MSVKRSTALDERILERLAEGALVTVLCRDKAMPSIRQLQRWRRADTEFDDLCWRSEASGLMIQRADYIERMLAAVERGGPGSSIEIQAMHNLLHDNARIAGRLISRMSEKQTVAHEGNAGYIIGWATDPTDTEPVTIDALPSEPSNGREHIDIPMRQPSLVEELDAGDA
jgi:hypothetical protein